VGRGGGDVVAAGVAVGGGRCAGLVEQVAPGALEQLPRNHVVGVALGNQDRQVGQPAGLDRDAGVEGEGAVEDRGTGVPSRVGES
jgi:hypothetical protein